MAGNNRLIKALFKFKALQNSKNSAELAQIIHIDSVYTNRVLDDIFKDDGDLRILETHKPKSLLEEFVILHFQAAIEYKHGSAEKAYKLQLDTYNLYLRIFQNQSRWAVPVIYAICIDLRKLAMKADRAEDKEKPQTELQEDAIRAINRGFSICMTDREALMSKSKKWGTYRLANMLFALYFRLGAFNMGTSMMRALNASELPSLDRFPMSEQVTFRYYRGILAFRDERYAKAKDDLMFALEHCHRDAFRNKARILMYLIPTQAMDGVLPRSRLMRRYPNVKRLYGDLMTATRTGNVGAFDRALANKESILIRHGVFLATEKIRDISLRVLFRRVYLAEDKNSRLPFTKFQAALGCMGLDLDLSELECILAGMVHKGYIKGYLAHEHETLVLSKQQPFPPLKGWASQP